MNKSNMFGVVGIGVGAACICYSAYISRKMNKLCNVLDTSVANIADKTEVDVSPAIVNRAIECSVDLAVGKAIRAATDEVISDIKFDMRKEVKTAVSSEYETIKKEVVGEVSKQVAILDMSKLKNEVREAAKEKVLEKFDGNLQDLLDDFNTNLQSVSKIYSSIADTLGKRESKETVLKLI